MHHQRLVNLLLSTGAVARDPMDSALALCREDPGANLIQALLSRDPETAQGVIQCFQTHLGIPFAESAVLIPNRDLASLVPQSLASQRRLIPLSLEGDTLLLVMADPLDSDTLQAVHQFCRKKVRPILAAESAIDLAISRLYGTAAAEQALRDLLPELPAEDPAAPSEAATGAPTIRLINSFLEFAASRNASDIHLEPRETELAVRMRIDGILHQTFSLPKQAQSRVLARVKVMGNLDLAEHQLPQDGRCSMVMGRDKIDLRISTLPTIYGEKIVIRLLRHNPALLNPGGLGLVGGQLREFETLLMHNSGVLLMAGPTGSGKSSTMYTIIDRLNSPEKNLVTLEDPVEYHWAGVNQVQIRESLGMDFASGLRSILRQDPDIIAVGEIRDTETADVAMRAAITGHLVLSTIHADDAPGALERLLDMGVAPYLIASGLKGIIAQRLVRKICPHCREREQTIPEQWESFGFTPGRIFRGAGCPRCFQTGYLGRTAVFEILPITPDIRRCLTDPHPRETLEQQVSHRNTLFQQGIRLVLEGVTSAEEIFRVLSPGAEGGIP